MRKETGLFIAGVFCFFSFVFYLISTHSIRDEQQERYCQERTRLGMQIYDSIREGRGLSEIIIPWKTESFSHTMDLYRRVWEAQLKAEVDYFILKGYLSMRVEERLYEQCLNAEGRGKTMPLLHEINV